jgi:hypothetical protein
MPRYVPTPLAEIEERRAPARGAARSAQAHDRPMHRGTARMVVTDG